MRTWFSIAILYIAEQAILAPYSYQVQKKVGNVDYRLKCHIAEETNLPHRLNVSELLKSGS